MNGQISNPPVLVLGIFRRTARENKCRLKIVPRNSTETIQRFCLVWGTWTYSFDF